MKDQTRRKFIVGCVDLTAVGFLGGFSGQHLLFPEPVEAANVQHVSAKCGVKNKNGLRILVTYSSEFGSTGEIAKGISEVLCHQGSAVETQWIRNVSNVGSYDAVVIGSAIQYDRWMPEAIEFVKVNRNALAKIPVAYFFTCLVLSQQTKKAQQQAKKYAEALQFLEDRVKPVSIGCFAGVLDYGRMSIFFRLVARVIFGIKGVAEGDYRDWRFIRSWAGNLKFTCHANT